MEMIEMLSRMDITAREYRIIWFLTGEIIGGQHIKKLIKMEKFVEATGLPARHIIPAIKSLIEKGLIKREATHLRGQYIYEFHQANFVRVIATKEIREDKKGLRLIQGGKISPQPELPKTGKSEIPDLPNSGNLKKVEVPALGNSPRLEMGPDSLREIQKSPEVKELNAPRGREREQTDWIHGDKPRDPQAELERLKQFCSREGIAM